MKITMRVNIQKINGSTVAIIETPKLNATVTIPEGMAVPDALKLLADQQVEKAERHMKRALMLVQAAGVMEGTA